MNKKLQQRIVGSIAVLALLILVVPHLFSSNEPRIPAPSNTESKTQTSNSNINNFDDFQSPTISVDPIPTISNPNNTASIPEDPISENTWNNVTHTTTNTSSQTSVAEQLLAEANKNLPPVHTNNTNSSTNKNTAKPNNNNKVNAQPDLPKIELIGSTQPKPNQKSQATSQPKFTWFVQVGSYSSKENASKAMMEYRKRGYSSEVAYLSGQFKVRIGPLKTEANAKNVQAELKRQGQNSYIIQIQ